MPNLCTFLCPSLVSRIKELERKVISLEGSIAAIRVNSVLSLDGHLSLDGSGTQPKAVFSAVNVQIVNGTGSTDSVNGLGNLVVGYDERRQEAPAPGHDCQLYDCSLGANQDPFSDDTTNRVQCEAHGGVWATNHKSGSHNLVVGQYNNYSSYSGVVFGIFNTVSVPHATAVGGYCNKATGIRASVTGGFRNWASEDAATVSGGESNTATAVRASVMGGVGNAAKAMWSSIAGGELNSVDPGGQAGTVTGGQHNKVTNFYACVTGGQTLTAGSRHCWKAGSGADTC